MKLRSYWSFINPRYKVAEVSYDPFMRLVNTNSARYFTVLENEDEIYFPVGYYRFSKDGKPALVDESGNYVGYIDPSCPGVRGKKITLLEAGSELKELTRNGVPRLGLKLPGETMSKLLPKRMQNLLINPQTGRCSYKFEKNRGYFIDINWFDIYVRDYRKHWISIDRPSSDLDEEYFEINMVAEKAYEKANKERLDKEKQ